MLIERPKQQKQLSAVTIATALALVFISCADGPTEPPPIASVQVTVPTAVLSSGATVQLTAVALSKDGKVLTGRVITWTSSNRAIATVSAAGIVTAEIVLSGTAESVTITASAEGIDGSATILVNPVSVATITINSPSAALTVGSTLQLTATISDSAGRVLTGRSVSWLSSDTVVATISSAGLVAAVTQGIAQLTASVEGKTGVGEVTVRRVFTNYLRTSYETRNLGRWLRSDDLLTNGEVDRSQDPLRVIQTVQLDINGDGADDVFTYDSYPMNTGALLPNPVPPRQFIARGGKLHHIPWRGPVLRQPHGVKLLVGDFNGDSLPDVFSLVAIDPPDLSFPVLRDFNHLLFNSLTGFNSAIEFDNQLGFWYTGASGDIDGDGDLDVVVFNFHVGTNSVGNGILWNNGNGTFVKDESVIGRMTIVDASELVDLDKDGFLDLVVSQVAVNEGIRTPSLRVLWGTGRGFTLDQSPVIDLGNSYVDDLTFYDVDADGIDDIIVAYNDGRLNGLHVIKTMRSPASLSDVTTRYVDISQTTQRFVGRFRLLDVDGNGRPDLVAADRASGIRWEWTGSQFVKRF